MKTKLPDQGVQLNVGSSGIALKKAYLVVVWQLYACFWLAGLVV